MTQRLAGVIAAIATAVDERSEPDLARSVAFAKYLLANGCDGLNVLGTTGEATSFSLTQRERVMSAYKGAGLTMNRLMVGTGAAALADAIALTQHAAGLGFGGALVLPPFYYKNVPDEGLMTYVAGIIAATSDQPIPIYLYNFPAMSGIVWRPDLVRKLRAAHGSRLAGLKDSSGDMAYAREMTTIADDFDVFPSNEAVLLEARDGKFAGCISATANVNSDLCGLAWRNGDKAAHETAVAIRKLFDGRPLVPGIKTLIGHTQGDPGWARTMPPLASVSAQDRTAILSGHDGLRARRVA